MAKFSQTFLQGLLQPSYQEGLFTAAQGIGAAPAMREQQRQQASLQKGLFGLEQMALSGDLTPEMYKEAVGSYTQLMKQNPAQADEIRKSLASVGASVRQQEKTRKKVTAVNRLSQIETEFSQLFADPSANPAKRDARAAQLRKEARQIQENNPLVDLSSFSNWDLRAQNAGMAVANRVKDQAAEFEQQSIDKNLQGMTVEQRQEYVDAYSGSESEYMLRRVNSFNAYDEGVQRRSAEAATRMQDLTKEIGNLENQIATLPEGLKGSLQAELNTVKAMQENGWNATNGWASKPLQNQANNKLNDVSRRIINHGDRVVTADLRSIRDAEMQISVLESQLDNPVITQKDLVRYAELAAEKLERTPFDKLSESKKNEYFRTARQTILREHNQNVNSQIDTQKAVIKYLSADKQEEQPTENSSDFSDLISTAQRESGLSREDTIKALKNKGDIPKGYTEQKESFEEAVKLDESEIITALFGEEGYILPLGLESTSVSRALLADRVYYAIDTNKTLAGVSTNDLEILQYEDNKYTPRIKAELARRRARNGKVQ